MVPQNNSITFRLLATVVGLFAVCCTQVQDPSNLASIQPDSESVQTSADVKDVELPGGGRGRVNNEGWPTPELASIEKNHHFAVQGAKTFDGKEVAVEAVKYEPAFGDMLVSSDVASAMRVGDLNVQAVSEYKAKNRTFAYVYLVNPAEIDKASNRIKSSRGFVFYFAIYDEGGDGKFETLATSEPSIDRLLRPHVPAWAAK